MSVQEKKKLPVPLIIGLVVIVLGGATVGILYATGVIGGAAPAVDTTASTPAPVTPPSGAQLPPGVPAPGGMARRPGMAMNPALKAKAKQDAKKAAMAKAAGKKVVATAPPTVPPGAPAAPGMPVAPGMPGAPGMPAAAPGAPAAAPQVGPDGKPIVVATTKPDPATVPDPFKLPKVEQPKVNVRVGIPGIPAIPSPMLSNWRPHVKVIDHTGGAVAGTEASSAGRRMAGVLFGDGVYAILETNGKTEAVQPGDTVEGGKVVSIEADGLTIKTDDDRTIHVPLSSTATTDTSNPTGGYPGGGFPGGGYPGGGYPGGGYPGGGYPGAPGGYRPMATPSY